MLKSVDAFLTVRCFVRPGISVTMNLSLAYKGRLQTYFQPFGQPDLLRLHLGPVGQRLHAVCNCFPQ